MATENNCCYLGRGEIYAKVCLTPAEVAAGDKSDFISLGNAETLTITPQVTTVEKKNYTSKAGGTECSIDTVDSVDVSMDLSCHTVGNLLKAFAGNEYEVASAPVVDEPHYLTALTGDGSYFILDLPSDGTAPVITFGGVDISADFTVNGDLLTYTGTSLLPGDLDAELLVSYTSQSYKGVVGLGSTQREFEIVFKGCNLNGSATNKFEVRLYRVKFSPSEFNFINDTDFNVITLAGKSLPDSRQVAPGQFSEYFNLCLVD